jgi:hypothetical protein
LITRPRKTADNNGLKPPSSMKLGHRVPIATSKL